MLISALRRFDGRTAFAGGDAVSYAALADTIGRFEAVLQQAGVGHDRTVAIVSRNRWDAWAAASAVSALGAAPCWLHPLGTSSAHVEQASLIDPAAIIVDDQAFPDRTEAFRQAFPGIAVQPIGSADPASGLHGAAAALGTASLKDFSQPLALGMVGLTGGTTGKSKAVERSVTSTASMSISTLASYGIPTRPRFLALGPISHVTGTMILPSFMRGGSVVLAERFDPEETLATIARERISFTIAVPTMIYDLLDSPALAHADMSTLKLLLYGASTMSPNRLAEGLDRIGPVFSQLYGQAECHPIAVLDKEDHDIARPELLAACGFATRMCEVKVFDEQMVELEAGGIGEICVRGAGVMRGYRDAPAATAEAFAGGWLHTGDLGRVDDEGRLYLVDRKKDMVVSGGFNVYPREIEDVLTSHPDVATAAVVGLPDPRWGEAIHAVVTLRPGRTFDEQSLCKLIRDRKGSLLTPKSFRVIDQFPLTAAGKIDKKRLAEQLRDVAP
jgi:fatty-acyl-CoA synthase